MKLLIAGLCFFLMNVQPSSAQSSGKDNNNSEQEVINLSKQKWLWMAEKKADSLAALFQDKSVFVHMGGSWGKEQEVNIIKNGGIHYKKAEIHSVSVNIIDNTAILVEQDNAISRGRRQ